MICACGGCAGLKHAKRHFYNIRLTRIDECFIIKSMLKQEKVEEFFQEFSRMLPEDIRTYKKDMEKNLKAALNATFARMDLVTREEFDIQSELLSKTRELLHDLENKVSELEEQLQQRGQKDS